MMGNFTEKIINRKGCNIHYWVGSNNDSPWLVFLHGAGADHRMFNEQMPGLCHRFNILLWDARGHGLSKPMSGEFSMKILIDDLIEIMNVESIDKASIIGQSLGGNIAQELTFNYPDKVENLILIDTTCNTMKLSSIEKFLVNITPSILSLYPWNTLVEQCVKASSIKPDIQSYLREVFNIVGKKDFARIFLEAASCLHYEKDYMINKNILLVCGEHDHTGNIKKIASKWASMEPQCDFFLIKNASHCSNQDNPDDFNRLLSDFLNKRC